MKRIADWYVVTSLLLKPLKECFIDVISCKLSTLLYVQYFPSKRINSFGFVFPNLLDRTIYEAEFPTHASFIFPLSTSLSLQIFLRHSKPSVRHCSHVVTLPVFCSGGTVEGNVTHKVNYRWDLRSSGKLRTVDW